MSPEVHFTSGFSDQPLPRRPGQDVPDDKNRTAPQLPDRIAAMKAMYNVYDHYAPANAYYFYKQAVFMADYEDDYDYKGTFQYYYPTYHIMTDAQLRGYFTWRTQYRVLEHRALTELLSYASARGDAAALSIPNPATDLAAVTPEEALPKSLSFLYLHLYELIHCVGASSALDAYRKLFAADALYGRLDRRLRVNIRSWMRDFVVYYQLPAQAASYFYKASSQSSLVELSAFEKQVLTRERKKEKAVSAASGESEQMDEDTVRRIFTAVQQAAGTDLTKSPFYKQYPEDMQRAVVKALSSLMIFCSHRKESLVRSVAGRRRQVPYHLFDNAVFYDAKKYADVTYEASSGVVFYCREGHWSRSSYDGGPVKSKRLGAILSDVERVMRIKFGFGHPLKQKLTDPAMEWVIEEAVNAYLLEKEEASWPRVQLDAGNLERIRQDAEHTRDQLLFEEDEMPSEVRPETRISQKPEERQKPEEAPAMAPTAAPIAAPVVPPIEPPAAPPVAEGHENAPGLLTEEQKVFLKRLYQGEEVQTFLSGHHLKVSLLADQINEALYDEIGDTVIELDGDQPSLIEDYREDVKGLID